MLVSAAEVLRERGAAGVTIDEVLARSGAPRGSVYHHFPERRSQILREALDFAGYEISASIDEAAGESATVLLRRFVQLWEDALTHKRLHRRVPGAGRRRRVRRGRAPADLGRRRHLQPLARGLQAGLPHGTVSSLPRPPRWPTPPSPRWRARWCCAGRYAASTAHDVAAPAGIPDQGKGIRDEVRRSDAQRLNCQRAQTKSPLTPVSASIHSERIGNTGAPEPRLHGA